MNRRLLRRISVTETSGYLVPVVAIPVPERGPVPGTDTKPQLIPPGTRAQDLII